VWLSSGLLNGHPSTSFRAWSRKELVYSRRGDNAMGIFDKAKDVLSGQQDKVDAGVEKAGDVVDEKTGDKYTEHVDQGQELAKDRLRDLTGDQPEPPA
jgi:MT0933-like antitoxin protein